MRATALADQVISSTITTSGTGLGDGGAAGAATVDVAGDAHAAGAAEAAADRLGREAVVGDDDDEHQAASPSGGPPSQ